MGKGDVTLSTLSVFTYNLWLIDGHANLKSKQTSKKYILFLFILGCPAQIKAACTQCFILCSLPCKSTLCFMLINHCCCCFFIQEQKLDVLYTEYCRNKPKSDVLVQKYTHSFFQVCCVLVSVILLLLVVVVVMMMMMVVVVVVVFSEGNGNTFIRGCKWGNEWGAGVGKSRPY